MVGSKAYQKRHAKARQRRRRTAAEVLEQTLHDLGIPDDLVAEIEGRDRQDHRGGPGDTLPLHPFTASAKGDATH